MQVAGHRDVLEDDPYLKQRLRLRDPYITTLNVCQAYTLKRIRDPSFQVTAQDVSTMLRCQQKSIIFLINNGGYTIEVVIHDGPYNVIKNWNYSGLIDAIHNGDAIHRRRRKTASGGRRWRAEKRGGGPVGGENGEGSEGDCVRR